MNLAVVIKENKNMLRIEKKKERKKEKKKERKHLVVAGFEPRTPAWESNVITAATANYVFKI